MGSLLEQLRGGRTSKPKGRTSSSGGSKGRGKAKSYVKKKAVSKPGKGKGGRP